MDDWIKAGMIASEAREYAKGLIKPGQSVYEVAEKIEEKIRSSGAVPGFPVNLSFDDFAAHCTPEYKDTQLFDSQLVKVDIGTCYNGAIGDTACTVDLSGKYKELVKATDEALKNVMKILQIGTTLGEIGKTIIETIQSHGYGPVKNLSGHGLSQYCIHDSPTIPNFDTQDKTRIQEGMMFAIEPFATDGAGIVKDSGAPRIFSLETPKPVRDQITRDVMGAIKEFNTLPFARRWLAKKMHEGKVNFGLRQMENLGILKSYPPLREVRGGMVSQAEHSFIVRGKVIPTTK